MLCCRVTPQEQRAKQQVTPATDAKRNTTDIGSASNGVTPRAGPSSLCSSAMFVQSLPTMQPTWHAASLHSCTQQSIMASCTVPHQSSCSEAVGAVAENAAAAGQSKEAGAGTAGPPASKKLLDAREWCLQYLSPVSKGMCFHSTCKHYRIKQLQVCSGRLTSLKVSLTNSRRLSVDMVL